MLKSYSRSLALFLQLHFIQFIVAGSFFVAALDEAVKKCVNLANSSRQMCDVLQHCLVLLTQQEQLRSQQLLEQKERCRILQESLRVLAVENHELEQQFAGSGNSAAGAVAIATSSGGSGGVGGSVTAAAGSSFQSVSEMSTFSDDSEDEEFFDCEILSADYKPGEWQVSGR